MTGMAVAGLRRVFVPAPTDAAHNPSGASRILACICICRRLTSTRLYGFHHFRGPSWRAKSLTKNALTEL